MELVVDRGRCTGNGSCEAEAPRLFEVQDDGSVRVLDAHPDASQREQVESAIAFCPTRAISLAAD